MNTTHGIGPQVILKVLEKSPEEIKMIQEITNYESWYKSMTHGKDSWPQNIEV